jgi:quercetin dioxygenase-like cupin family protein
MKTGLDPAYYPTPVDQETVAADWAAEGFSFGVFRDPPGQCWEDFTHATDEYVVVAEGELELKIDGASHRAREGDRARIPARAIHSVRTISPGGSVWLYGYGPKGARHG